MVRIVQKGFRDIGRLTDRREIDRFALLLEALDGFARAEPGLLTLLCGEADHRLGVRLSIHFVPPRFFERWSAGRCTSARTSSIPLIWSARSLAYISLLSDNNSGPSPKEVSLLAVKKPRNVIEFHQ